MSEIVWTPVEDGNLVPTVTDGEMWAYERDGKKGKAVVLRKDHFHGDIILEDGYAVCRATEAEPVAIPAEVRELLERLLLFEETIARSADDVMTQRIRRVDAALAWLSSLGEEG